MKVTTRRMTGQNKTHGGGVVTSALEQGRIRESYKVLSKESHQDFIKSGVGSFPVLYVSCFVPKLRGSLFV